MTRTLRALAALALAVPFLAADSDKNVDQAMTPDSRGVSARFRALLTLCICTALISSGSAGHACTRVFWNDHSIAKVVGRNADWFEAQTDPRAASDPKLLVLPRGLSKSGAMNGTDVVVPQNPARWTSLHGSVVVANYDSYVMDGMNEKGLAAHALALGGTRYGNRDVSRGGINMNLLVQFLLDNAATVAEALALLPRIQPVVVGIDGYATGLSFSIEDATGDSAVVEYIDGVAEISRGTGFCVTANTKLTEAKLLLDAYDFNFTNTTRSVPVPGNTSSVDRFIRASYYRGLLGHVTPRNALEARAAMMSVMRNVSDPIGAPGDVAGAIHETDWRTVYDLTSRAFVFENPRMLTTLTTDLTRLNFAAGTGVRIVDPLEPNLPNDITDRYQPTDLPVPAVGGAPPTGQALISFSRLGGGEASIFSIRADGEGETRVTKAPPSRMDLHSTWSADGSWVAFTELSSDRSRIVTMRADGSARRNITAGGAYYDLVPSIAPDGSRIAYTSNRSGNYEVYTIAADGTDEQRITHSAASVTYVGPKYSPDGTQLLVAMRESPTDPNQDLYILNADGTGTPRRLTTGADNAESRAWSPDGTRVVFNNVVDGVGQIFVINTNGTGMRQITTNSGNTPPLHLGDFFPIIRGDVTPAWSPDGEWIAFASDRTGNFEVNIVRPDGTSLRQVTNTTNHELSLGWRPLVIDAKKPRLRAIERSKPISTLHLRRPPTTSDVEPERNQSASAGGGTDFPAIPSGAGLLVRPGGLDVGGEDDDVHDVIDNCPGGANTNQADANQNGVGDVCECGGSFCGCGDGIVESGEECDDGNLVSGDGCASDCTLDCPNSPPVGCRQAGTSLLTMKDPATSSTAQLVDWKWTRGASTTVADFGDPKDDVTDDWLVCLWANGALRMTAEIPAGGSCAGMACWKEKTSGFLYSDEETTPDGVLRATFQSGSAGRAKVLVKFKDSSIPRLSLGALAGPVVIQLRGPTCFESTFQAPFRSQASEKLVAKTVQ